MAKMFYTLEETAAKLGVDVQAVKEMAANRQLQPFRDRDKLMFKCEQVDGMAADNRTSGGTAAGESDSDMTSISDLTSISDATALGEESGTSIPLVESSDTDAIDLSADTSASDATQGGTGVDVFETGEVEAADSMAKTHVTEADDADHDEEIGLESVGSGSGLLDLTQESDDTSLGAELLDEIYPGAEGSQGTEESAGSAGGTKTPESGLADLGEEQEIEPMGGVMAYASEAMDPAGSGFGAGMLLGAIVALVLGLIVTISAITGVQSALATTMSGSIVKLGIWSLGLLVLSFILGFIGATIGKATGR